jgi:hypothetical protein
VGVIWEDFFRCLCIILYNCSCFETKNCQFLTKNYTALKNFTYLFLAGLFSIVILNVSAQVSYFNPVSQKNIQQIPDAGPKRSCPTFELMEKAFTADPAARLRYSRTQEQLQQAQQNRGNSGAQLRVQAIITVPVVVHVMLPAAEQALVTDAIIQNQLDTLNFYYGGSPLNADSLRVYDPFRTTYGRSEIRFCLAQRTPANLPTTGITRNVTSTIYDGTNVPGNAVVWDPTKYLNIWVVNGGNSGLLGYSYTPGTWPPADPHQGFVNDYRSFGAGPGSGSGGYHFDKYNGGKTAVHEIGHYFNLAHTWGPNNSGNPGCNLSDGCADTPPTVGPFFDCPNTIPVLDACSGTAPGIMWQNHMDYADDRCMILFTKEQCARMMTAINNSADRVGLTTSNGCVAPPPSPGNDASISAIISPSNGSTMACSSITPVVTIMNLGSNPLATASINVTLNGTPVTGSPFAWAGGPLAQGNTANVTLPSITIGANGAYTLKAYTSNPNGLVDANMANDTSTVTFTKVAPGTIPTSNDFEAAFLPPGWSIANPGADVTWGWYGPGAGGSTGATAIDNYNFNLVGATDDVRTTVLNTSSLLANDSLLVTWDLAHKNYPNANDKLEVLVSANCGATFTTVWTKSGATLATAGASTAFFSVAAAGDWVKQRASIGQNLFGGGQIIVAFRNTNDFGNVVWIDNINILIKPRKDMQALTMVRPLATECAPPFAPSLTVRNNGGELVTGFKTGYILDGGAPVIQSHNIPLNTGQSATVTFANLTPTSGTHTIKMFVTDALTAEPGPDGTPGNDTLTRQFTVPVTGANVVEGFEGNFVPANWALINPNSNATWMKDGPGKSSASAAFFDNYNNNLVNQLDMLQTPPVNTVNAESVTISFDVAHKNYPGGLDRLRVLASTDCGVTFTSVYSKSGATLATAAASDLDFTTPTDSEWRRETITLNNTFTGGNIIFQFENRNDWGNNIFIDNVNIAPMFKRDLAVVSVSPEILCTTGFTPSVTVRNNGTEAITGFKIGFQIGTGAADTTTFTGVNIAPGATHTVTLSARTLVNGANTITVYSVAPVTASGTGDQYTVNDRIVKTSYVTTATTAPLLETFEGGFVPAGWAISNADGAITWQKASTGFNSAGSAFIRNFGYASAGQKDALYTPVFNFTGVDSVKVTFDLSAATKDYPGSTTIGMDTLEVLATRDCGATFTTVYKKWGSDLQTVGDPNNPVTGEYTPNAYYLWRNETIDLTSFASEGPLQLVFRNTTNNQNNIFIDNVNFTTKTFPDGLRAQGYIITPNPFTEQFNLWYTAAPTDLRYVAVYNSTGQLIWNRVFNSGSPSNVITVDLTGKAAGVYILNLGYSDKSKDQQIRIIKSN